MYHAIAFAFDGESIQEGEFKTVQEAWNRINDWGSRWIFYPITGVIKNARVVSMCDGFEFLQNKNKKTVKTYIAQHPDLSNLL